MRGRDGRACWGCGVVALAGAVGAADGREIGNVILRERRDFLRYAQDDKQS